MPSARALLHVYAPGFVLTWFRDASARRTLSRVLTNDWRLTWT
jgi:hypothetical protein